MPTPTLTMAMVEVINQILDRGNQAEVKIEKGEIVIIKIKRKKCY